MNARLKSFARFWYNFFVGDDWTIGAGVLVALAATYGLHQIVVDTWWIVSSAAVILLVSSVVRAASGRGRGESDAEHNTPRRSDTSRSP